MKVNRIKRIRLIALALATAVLFSSCAQPLAPAPEMELSASLPPPGNGEGGTFAASLYFLSGDGLSLYPEERQVVCRENESRAAAAIRALIDGPVSTALSQSVPGDMRLQRVETSEDACNVYLLSSYVPDARAWITARAAIAATVSACEGIPSTNLYLNGMEPGYYGRAFGAMYPVEGALDAYITSLQNEYKAISQGTGNSEVDAEIRALTLYFTNDEKSLLIAENINITYNAGANDIAIAALLLDRLARGSEVYEPTLPQDFAYEYPTWELLSEQQEEGSSLAEEDLPHPVAIIPGEDGEEQDSGMSQADPAIIRIILRQRPEEDALQMLCGAITLTLTGYLPNISGVAIDIMNENGSVESLSGGEYFTREDFSEYIGRTVGLACPDESGEAMHIAGRMMRSADAYNPRRVLEALLSGSEGSGGGIPLFGGEDILDAYVTGDTAVINWREGFSAKLMQLVSADEWNVPAEMRERMFIYCIVNTLTGVRGINRVWMLEEGEKLGQAGEIYLGNALMRNPGIIMGE